MEALIQELLQIVRYIPLVERQSKWYKDYLDKITNDLKIENDKPKLK